MIAGVISRSARLLAEHRGAVFDDDYNGMVRPANCAAGPPGRYGRALAGAHVEAAGGDAGQQAAVGWQAQQLAQAEAGIEMIARAGRDFGFGGEGALDQRRAIGPGGQRVGCRMDDDGVHADALVDVFAELQQPVRRMVAGIQAQVLPDLICFPSR